MKLECILLDCRTDPDGEAIAVGPHDEISRLVNEKNRAVGATRPIFNGKAYRWPFMYAPKLAENDCRQDLVAIQARKLAAMEARGERLPVQLELV